MRGFVLGLLCGVGLTAMAAGSSGSVVGLTSAPVRVAPSGTAKVYLLARGENAFIGRLELDAGAAVPEHRDPTEEFIHVLQGTGTLTMNGVPHVLGPGATVYMPANAEVSYANGPERMIAVQVFAGPGPADKYDAWTLTPAVP
ncbi:MAG: quercetin dioxygenase-like cupin family protein [Myxococcota bacterium]|jgi:quercetin dioxygenase-like cupin family protein